MSYLYCRIQHIQIFKTNWTILDDLSENNWTNIYHGQKFQLDIFPKNMGKSQLDVFRVKKKLFLYPDRAVQISHSWGPYVGYTQNMNKHLQTSTSLRTFMLSNDIFIAHNTFQNMRNAQMRLWTKYRDNLAIYMSLTWMIVRTCSQFFFA